MDNVAKDRVAKDLVAPARHPSIFEPATLILLTVLCVVGAIIGMQMLVTLGVTANTSIVGALVAMALARIPMELFSRFRSIHVQNLAQSAISAATFGAGNSLLLPIGIPFLLGRGDLVLPLLGGVALAMLVDATMLFRMFGSRAFPAEGAWPPGVAAAEAIRAGDEGGRRIGILGFGVVAGVVGTGFLGIPMSAFGVAFIGNVWALSMFGIGLLVRGYSPQLFSGWLPRGDIGAAFIPHGIMIGAGLVALVQVATVLLARRTADGPVQAGPGRALGVGSLAYMAIAVLIALGGGLSSELSTGMLVLFIVYAAFAALVHELIVGLAAMHSGWFPAFAVTLITLIGGMLIGFPPVSLALLVGFSAATGPAFADMGYDLKAGFMLRGHGADPAFERDGRFQQYLAAMFAFVVAGLVVLVSYQGYFASNLVAPVAKVYVATIKAGAAPGVAWQLLLWAIPGALLQLAGGPTRQMGVLFATGMLIVFPAAGWAVLAGVVLRLVYGRLRGPEAQGEMEVFAGGAIAGDALTGFYNGVAANLKR
ncbi:MAG: OPT/YSL family transporter [Janthinobacterium lividum]